MLKRLNLAFTPQSIRSRFPLAIWLTVYTLVSLNHEPWVDEIQQMQIALAMNPSFGLLNVSYLEATPSYWFATLWVFGSLFGVELGLKALGLLLATLTGILWYSIQSIPLWLRISISFSLVVFFEYLIVVRVYAFTLLLLVWYLWKKRNHFNNALPSRASEIIVISLLGMSSIWGAYVGGLIFSIGLCADPGRFREWKAIVAFCTSSILGVLNTQIGVGRQWPGQRFFQPSEPLWESMGNSLVALRNALLPMPNLELQAGTFWLSSMGSVISGLTALMTLSVVTFALWSLGLRGFTPFALSVLLLVAHMTLIYLGGLRHWGFFLIFIGVILLFNPGPWPQLRKWAFAVVLAVQGFSSLLVSGQDLFKPFSVGLELSKLDIDDDVFVVALDDPSNVMAGVNMSGVDVYSIKGGDYRPYWLLSKEGQKLVLEKPSSCLPSNKLVAISSNPVRPGPAREVIELQAGFNANEDNLWILSWETCTVETWNEVASLAQNSK